MLKRDTLDNCEERCVTTRDLKAHLVLFLPGAYEEIYSGLPRFCPAETGERRELKEVSESAGNRLRESSFGGWVS